MTRAEIIARIEAGETGRELDAEICVAIGYEVRNHHGHGAYYEPVVGESWRDVPHYTTSIDASELLPGEVLEVAKITLMQDVPGAQPYPTFEALVGRTTAHAPTEAAARTAAKLKALEGK